MSRQLTFANARAARRSARRSLAGPNRRKAAAAKSHARARAAAAPTTAQREAAMAMLRELLSRFIRGLGVGAEFQSSDFTDWMLERGERPCGVDPRSLGGVIPRLRAERVISFAGYRMNGGSRFTKAGSTPRAVWRIERLPA